MESGLQVSTQAAAAGTQAAAAGTHAAAAGMQAATAAGTQAAAAAAGIQAAGMQAAGRQVQEIAGDPQNWTPEQGSPGLRRPSRPTPIGSEEDSANNKLCTGNTNTAGPENTPWTQATNFPSSPPKATPPPYEECPSTGEETAAGGEWN